MSASGCIDSGFLWRPRQKSQNIHPEEITLPVQGEKIHSPRGSSSVNDTWIRKYHRGCIGDALLSVICVHATPPVGSIADGMGKTCSRYYLHDSKKCPMTFAYYLHVGTNCVHQSYLWIEGPRLCLKLKTRKNRQHGTTLWRECWCGTSAMSRFTCPIHTFGHPYDCSPWLNTWSMVHCQEYGPKWRMKECPCFLHSSRVWSTKDYGSCFMMLVSKIQKATDLTIYAVGSCIVCF